MAAGTTCRIPDRANRNVSTGIRSRRGSAIVRKIFCYDELKVRGNTIDILLVEDNPGDVRQFTSFVHGDFNISVAESGAEALDRVFRRGRFQKEPFPDLVVLDLSIPVLNGHEVLKVIRGNSKTFHLPVVIWSGSMRPDDISKAYELGCCAYMVKAAQLTETETVLSAFAQFWLRCIRYPICNVD